MSPVKERWQDFETPSSGGGGGDYVADMRQHLYVVGKSGSGESTLLRSMMLGNMVAGHGMVLIGPHAELTHYRGDVHYPRLYEHIRVVYGRASRESLSDVVVLSSFDSSRGTHSQQKLDNLFEELEACATYDWDGLGAAAVSKETLDVARGLLEQLPRSAEAAEVAPGADGSVGIEWHWTVDGGVAKAFVDVGPGSQVSVYYRDHSGRSVERRFSFGDPSCMKLISELVEQSGLDFL